MLPDFDVAELYGVETKRVNEAVKNNPKEFPYGYILVLTIEEWNILKSKNSTLKNKSFRPGVEGVCFTAKGGSQITAP